jgi:hypothetical protein
MSEKSVKAAFTLAGFGFAIIAIAALMLLKNC